MIDTSKMNTDEVLEIAKRYAKENGINDIVVATTTGETGVLASHVFNIGFNLVAVTHSTGFKSAGEQELLKENKKMMLEGKVRIFTGPMIFHSWNDYYRKKQGAIMPTTIIADTLRIFGQGTKVAVEIIAMAADAGLIPPRPVIGIGGTGHGADTVILAEGTNSKKLFDMKVIDVIAKPKEW
jgi:hypothetical protein